MIKKKSTFTEYFWNVAPKHFAYSCNIPAIFFSSWMCGLFYVTCVWLYSIFIFIYAFLCHIYLDRPRTETCNVTDMHHFWGREQWKVNTKVQILSVIVFCRNYDARKVQFLRWLVLDGDHCTNRLICPWSTVWLSVGLLASSSHRKCVSRTQDGPS